MKIRNGVLRSLPDPELSWILSTSEIVNLAPRQVLHHYRLPMEYVYFIEEGLVSVGAKIGSDKFIEVWLVGSEGLVGSPLALSARSEPLHRRIVQVGGQAVRIRSTRFSELLYESPSLKKAIDSYLSVLLVQTAQSGACNAAHSLRHRLARWILLARRALDSDEIFLTHDVLAQLLCVRRASVTECLNELQREGLIRLERSLIFVQNQGKLLDWSCDCFKIIDRQYERLGLWGNDRAVDDQPDAHTANTSSLYS
jgi:CRP-like cAMP-binding protein